MLEQETPAMLFAKELRKATDKATNDLTMVEWLHDDDLDAKSDFFYSSIWEFPDGGGKPGKLRQECSSWRMFRHLPDLDFPGEEMKPEPGFDFWEFFHRLFRIHEGEVAGMEDSEWVCCEGWPPMKKNFWHCQYMHGEESYAKAVEFGCRGAPRKKKSQGKVKVDREESSSLTARQVLTIGSTNICWWPDSALETKWEEDARGWWSEKEKASDSQHWRRRGTMVSYMRFLVFLLNEQLWGISIYTAESWWKSMPKICQARVRFKNEIPKGRSKGGSSGNLSDKGKK